MRTACPRTPWARQCEAQATRLAVLYAGQKTHPCRPWLRACGATRLGLASLFQTWHARGLNPFQECHILLHSR